MWISTVTTDLLEQRVEELHAEMDQRQLAREARLAASQASAPRAAGGSTTVRPGVGWHLRRNPILSLLATLVARI